MIIKEGTWCVLFNSTKIAKFRGAEGEFSGHDLRWVLQYVITAEDSEIICGFDIEGPGWRRLHAGAADVAEKRAFLHAAGLHYAHFDLAHPGIGLASITRFIANRAAMPSPPVRSALCRCRGRLLTEEEQRFFREVLQPLARARGDEVFMHMRLDALLKADRELRRRLAGCSLDFVIAGRADTAIRCGVELCGAEHGVHRHPDLAAAAGSCGLRLVRLRVSAGRTETEEALYG